MSSFAEPGLRVERGRVVASAMLVARPAVPADPRASEPLATSLAMNLALAHLVDDMLEDGRLRSAAKAAALLGVTRARLSQLMALLFLEPSVQDSILAGEAVTSERALRSISRMPAWSEQVAHLAQEALND